MADGRVLESVGRFAPAHGQSASSGQTLVFEAVPDGVRPLDPEAAQPEVPRTDTKFTSQTAKDAARKRWELDKRPDFASKELEYVPTADFKVFDEGRRDLLQRKAAEVTTLTGGASVGVMTTLRGYAWLVAFAEFYATRSAKTGADADADRARRFFKDASIELAKAHELARAEASARPRKSATDRAKAAIAADLKNVVLPPSDDEEQHDEP